MKKIIPIALGGLLILAFIYLNSVQGGKGYTSSLIYLRDISDTNIVGLKASSIEQFYGLDTNMWNGERFTAQLIGDLPVEKEYHLELSAANEAASNRFIRQAQVNQFRAGIEKDIGDIEAITSGKSKSLIYSQIAASLNELANDTAEKRTLIVCSNLMENSDVLSFYTPNIQRMLHDQPNAVSSILERAAHLPNSLSGITVYFIYEPKDYNEGLRYRDISSLYEKMLAEKGAEVIIKANLPN